MSYGCGPLDFAGVDRATLQLWLSEAQRALHELSIGSRVVTASYAQGDGSQAVTYTQADAQRLSAHIGALQQALGLGRARRPIRFVFR